MSTIVQKFGGTSVGSTERINRMADRVIQEKNKGHDVVVVVSAMGKTTDTLVKLVSEITTKPSKREMDMLLSTGEQVTISLLAMALQQRGVEAISFTGWQAGIQTDSVLGNAHIQEIDTKRIRNEMDHGKVVVVAGFQGVTEDGDISTLGRGGSDITAAALASTLKADRCDIYTDVDGVYTSDPRFVPKASKINSLSYEDMLNLAVMGAGVLHPRAVKHAKKFGIPLYIKSSFENVGGTLIHGKVKQIESSPVIGVTFEKDINRVEMFECEDVEGSREAIMRELATRHIQADVYTQSCRNILSLLIKEQDLQEILFVLRKEKDRWKYSRIEQRSSLSKVSVIGQNMKSQPEIKIGMCKMLLENAVRVKLIGESSISVTAVIEKSHIQKAVESLHTGFGLDYEDILKATV
ncbi:aspartate kinase [Rossellomorea sp. SC111]|uniref:aspartate kinase n=1 Tax=Rossellomorea sp. SC111 TaxID=2968985 RepID=UPI00215B3B52|nr:aspartate kinase [Rossellomorea sp. SC111]MCR8847725.1 aspartate kinase [Rossellomorea sp. SC111]